MEKLPKFFFAESPETPGAGFILATQRPCYLIKVFKFNKPEEFDRFMLNNSDAIQVYGYMIALTYFDTIGEHAKNLDKDDLQVCLKQACEFYLENKIKTNARYYNRHLI